MKKAIEGLKLPLSSITRPSSKSSIKVEKRDSGVSSSKDLGQSPYSKDLGQSPYSKDLGQSPYSKDLGPASYLDSATQQSFLEPLKDDDLERLKDW